MTLKKGNREIKDVPATVFNLLYYLIQNKDRVVKRDEIINNVWQTQFIGKRTIDVHITKIRKLLDAPNTDVKNSCVQTVINHGYKFTAQATIEESPDSRMVATVEGITLNHPYKLNGSKSEVIVTPSFISDSNYGQLVTYSKYGSLVSIPIKEFLSTFVILSNGK